MPLTSDIFKPGTKVHGVPTCELRVGDQYADDRDRVGVLLTGPLTLPTGGQAWAVVAWDDNLREPKLVELGYLRVLSAPLAT